jgi:hypothetical protein
MSACPARVMSAIGETCGGCGEALVVEPEVAEVLPVDQKLDGVK